MFYRRGTGVANIRAARSGLFPWQKTKNPAGRCSDEGRMRSYCIRTFLTECPRRLSGASTPWPLGISAIRAGGREIDRERYELRFMLGSSRHEKTPGGSPGAKLCCDALAVASSTNFTWLAGEGY